MGSRLLGEGAVLVGLIRGEALEIARALPMPVELSFWGEPAAGPEAGLVSISLGAPGRWPARPRNNCPEQAWCALLILGLLLDGGLGRAKVTASPEAGPGAVGGRTCPKEAHAVIKEGVEDWLHWRAFDVAPCFLQG